VLKDIVNTGVDIINPLDPDDKMDLETVRGGAGKKIILCGGMDKHFFDWEEAVQLEFLQNLTRKGRAAGPFILMDSAGVPDNVTKDRFDAFMRMYRSVR
jgi:uroporphyrinogen-III decarboxylase